MLFLYPELRIQARFELHQRGLGNAEQQPALVDKCFLKQRLCQERVSNITLEFDRLSGGRALWEFANPSLELLTLPLLALRCPRMGGVQLLNAVPNFTCAHREVLLANRRCPGASGQAAKIYFKRSLGCLLVTSSVPGPWFRHPNDHSIRLSRPGKKDHRRLSDAAGPPSHLSQFRSLRCRCGSRLACN